MRASYSPHRSDFAIFLGASADARKSIERLVHDVYGTDDAARYLANMRTPRLSDDVIDPNHWVCYTFALQAHEMLIFCA